MRRILLVSLVLATALLAASAGRAQMMGPGSGMSAGFFSNGGARGATMLTAPRDMSVMARSWLDALHHELGIDAPQRAALAERFMAQRHESALAALYQALSPSQRAILDPRFAAACAPGGLFGS